jgi:hypothetical protein
MAHRDLGPAHPVSLAFRDPILSDAPRHAKPRRVRLGRSLLGQKVGSTTTPLFLTSLPHLSSSPLFYTSLPTPLLTPLVHPSPHGSAGPHGTPPPSHPMGPLPSQVDGSTFTVGWPQFTLIELPENKRHVSSAGRHHAHAHAAPTSPLVSSPPRSASALGTRHTDATYHHHHALAGVPPPPPPPPPPYISTAHLLDPEQPAPTLELPHGTYRPYGEHATQPSRDVQQLAYGQVYGGVPHAAARPATADSFLGGVSQRPATADGFLAGVSVHDGDAWKRRDLEEAQWREGAAKAYAAGEPLPRAPRQSRD